jgi:hypothetical protein
VIDCSDEYNVFRGVRLPQWFSKDALGTTAVLTGAVALAVMLLAGWLGGPLGERCHRRADHALPTPDPAQSASPTES